MTKIFLRLEATLVKGMRGMFQLEKPLSQAKKEVAKQDKSYSLILLNQNTLFVSRRHTKILLSEFYLSIYST